MDASVVMPSERVMPGGGPGAVPVREPVQAVDFFIQTVAGLYEKDYGDFMREVILHLEHLRERVGGREDVNRLIDEMKFYTGFASDFDIESTRSKLLRDARSLRASVRTDAH